MRITAGKRSIEEIREDIARRRQEYEDERDRVSKAESDASRNYRRAVDEGIQPVVNQLKEAFAQWETMDPQIDGSMTFGKYYEIYIRCEYGQPDGNALRWTYKVVLTDDGVVEKETSSWSGLEATTEENLHSLEQLLEALRYLNSLNWAELLNRPVPDPEEFYKDVPKRPAVQNFDQELIAAELENIIGEQKLIRVKNWESCPWRGEVYIRILRETPSQYVINIVPTYVVLGDETERARLDSYLGEDRYDVYRVKKTSIKPVTPVDVVDI